MDDEADARGETRQRKPTWPLLAFSVLIVGYFGFQYVRDFSDAGVDLSSIPIGTGIVGLSFGLISQSRLSGLPDTIKEQRLTRRLTIPSAIIGLCAAGGLLVAGLI